MRRMILSTLVLLPVLAHGQVSTSAESKPSSASVLYQVELTRPVGLAEVAMAAAKPVAIATSVASVPANKLTAHATVHEFIQTKMVDDFARAIQRRNAALGDTIMGSEPTESSAPKLAHAVEVGLTPAELSERPGVTLVAARATVNEFGIPYDVTVTQSAGSVVDRKAMAAISGYRFKPATVDNQPVQAAVEIVIKIQNQ
jgi:hypothetical protein